MNFSFHFHSTLPTIHKLQRQIWREGSKCRHAVKSTLGRSKCSFLVFRLLHIRLHKISYVKHWNQYGWERFLSMTILMKTKVYLCLFSTYSFGSFIHGTPHGSKNFAHFTKGSLRILFSDLWSFLRAEDDVRRACTFWLVSFWLWNCRYKWLHDVRWYTTLRKLMFMI